MQACVEAVDDAEVEPTVQRGLVLDLHGSEAVGGGAHQLEEDEHVEEVGRDAGPTMPARKSSIERVVVRLDRVEIAGPEEERDRHEAGGQEGDAGAEGIDHQHDPNAVAVVRRPPGDPRHEAATRSLIEQIGEEAGFGERNGDGDDVDRHA